MSVLRIIFEKITPVNFQFVATQKVSGAESVRVSWKQKGAHFLNSLCKHFQLPVVAARSRIKASTRATSAGTSTLTAS